MADSSTNNINAVPKGMVKDLSPFQHNEQTASFVLNGIYANIDGRVATVQTESGNSACWSLPDGYEMLGAVNLGRDEILVISKSETYVQFGVVTECNYEMMINTSCLTANISNYKKGLFRILKGCERVIYLYDGLNYDLAINLDSLIDYTQQYEVIVNGKPVLRNYTVEEANAGDLWECNLMRLEREYQIPCIESVEVNDGNGNMELGKWRFAIELLDNDLNSIGFSPISQGVDIWDESINNDWLDIDGGFNMNDEEYPPAAGGVLPTSKSVTLSITNLDTRFAYARIYGIVKRTGGGVTTETFAKGDLITIAGEATEYLFDGISAENGDTISNINTITTIRERYKSSAAMEFVDRRLIRANLTKEAINWADYQRVASAIGVRYATNDIQTHEKALGDSTNPNTPFSMLTLMGDEVEPHAIVYEHADGSFSPPMHIPGRASEIDDMATVGAWFDQLEALGYPDEAAYNALPDDEKLRYWQVYNTADDVGKLAYYECPNNCYPELVDCNGESIWGNDINGNPLVNTPIRHPKMPDRCIQPHVNADGSTVKLLGLTFTNIQYPNDNVVSHHFVRPKRTDSNRTVAATGWISNACEERDYIGVSYFRNFASQHQQFISPETLINGSIISGTYAKEVMSTNIAVGATFNDTFQDDDKTYGTKDVTLWMRTLRPDNYFCNESSLNTIEDNRMLNSTSKSIADTTIVNLLWDNKVNYMKYAQTRGGFNNIRYVTLKRNKEVFCNLDSIQYYRGHSCGLTGEESTVFTGHNYISEMTQWRTLLADINQNNLTAIFAALGVAVAAALSVVTAGTSLLLAGIIASVGITAIAAAAIVQEIKDGKYEECRTDNDMGFVGTGGNLDGEVLFNSEYIVGLWCESPINFEMIHAGTSDYTRRFEEFFGGDFVDGMTSYLRHKVSQESPSDPTNLTVRPLLLPESYLYNPDYSGDQIGNVYVPLGINFDYCTNCDDVFPNTAIWSQRSFEREVSDANRVFLPLDTTEIGNHSGDITNLKYDKNRLLVTTENSAFVLSPNPRTLQTDAEQVFTGVGDFLSIPEQEFLKTNYGYGGCQHRYAAVNTPYGWVYPDAQGGEIFIYSNSLTRLSDKGMKHWFKNNLPFSTTEHVPTDTLHQEGVGLMATYDARYDRYILTKRDFEPIINRNIQVSYDEETNRWIVNNNILQQSFVAEFGDPQYFIDKSWTISYSFPDQAWASFHSYLPSYIFNNHETFFTFNDAEQSWKHDELNYTEYYGVKKDFVVEYILNNVHTTDLHALHWFSQAKVWDHVHKRWVDRDDISFDRMLIYNSSQSTGLQQLTYLDKDLNPYGNRIGWSNTEKDVVRIEKDYKVSAIRDLSTAQPVVTSEWSRIADDFYIDLVSNDDNIDYNRNQHNLPDLKDKYHIVRLYSNPNADAAIEFNLVNSKTFASIH